MTGSATEQSYRAPMDYGLAVEACLMLLLSAFAVRLVPFRMLASWMGKPVAPARRPTDSRRVALAVKRAARRVPWRAVCIHQGFALQIMLRRRGVDSQFIYGLSSSPNELKAHVWVRLGSEILIGAEAALAYVEVAAFPGVDERDPLVERLRDFTVSR